MAWLTWQTGQLPWVALALAATFGLYGLLRKTAALGPLEGLALETLLLFPLAFVWLAANAGRFGFSNLPSEPWHWSTTGG